MATKDNILSETHQGNERHRIQKRMPKTITNPYDFAPYILYNTQSWFIKIKEKYIVKTEVAN